MERKRLLLRPGRGETPHRRSLGESWARRLVAALLEEPKVLEGLSLCCQIGLRFVLPTGLVSHLPAASASTLRLAVSPQPLHLPKIGKKPCPTLSSSPGVSSPPPCLQHSHLSSSIWTAHMPGMVQVPGPDGHPRACGSVRHLRRQIPYPIPPFRAGSRVRRLVGVQAWAPVRPRRETPGSPLTGHPVCRIRTASRRHIAWLQRWYR